MKIAVLHPDLGLGGAERLIVDVVSVLVARGHEVHVHTSHYDKTRCFEETKQFKVFVHGDFLPTGQGGLQIMCACARASVCALLACLWRYDVVVCDSVPLYALLCRVLTSAPSFFYVHYPDKLLARGGGGGVKARLRHLYRCVFDLLEEGSLLVADELAVNSAFTRSVFHDAFPRLRDRPPRIVHPSVHFDDTIGVSPGSQRRFFLSINRYEKKKDVGLAVRALAKLKRRDVRLVIAGGYDARVPENEEVLSELKQEVANLGLQGCVEFLVSVSDEKKCELFAEAIALLYTPQNEHFGIVPLEAMGRGVPVVACDSVGPLETVGQKGFLVKPTPQGFAAAMQVLLEEGKAEAMGRRAQAHAREAFGWQAFSDKVEECVLRTAACPKRLPLLAWIGLLVLVAILVSAVF